MGGLDVQQKLKIYTDGACSGNPGPGGWGVVLIWGDVIKQLSGGENPTTNNRMELKGAIEALKSVKKKVPIEIYTDSVYVKDGITKWIHQWRKTNWNNGKVKNQDLWTQLSDLCSLYSISWHWVKGHSTDKYNNMADELARSAVKK